MTDKLEVNNIGSADAESEKSDANLNIVKNGC